MHYWQNYGMLLKFKIRPILPEKNEIKIKLFILKCLKIISLILNI